MIFCSFLVSASVLLAGESGADAKPLDEANPLDDVSGAVPCADDSEVECVSGACSGAGGADARPEASCGAELVLDGVAAM